VIALGALWFFALIFWTFGIVDNWRPAWFVAALVFSTIVLATLVYFIGRRVEEKAMMIQGN
jgi:Na+-driven multidrug efflux pump